jgi:hypothetical protein
VAFALAGTATAVAATPAKVHGHTAAWYRVGLTKAQARVTLDEDALVKLAGIPTTTSPKVGGPPYTFPNRASSTTSLCRSEVEPDSHDPPGDTSGIEVAALGHHHEVFCLTVTNTGVKIESGNPVIDTLTVSTAGADNVAEPSMGNVPLANCPQESGTGCTLSPGQTTSMAITWQMPDGQNIHTLTFSADPGSSSGTDHSANWTLTPVI